MVIKQFDRALVVLQRIRGKIVQMFKTVTVAKGAY